MSQKRARQARQESAKKPVRKSVLRTIIDTFKGAAKEVRK